MLIDFTVENFRSIKEPVTLSAVAQKSKIVPAGKNSTRYITTDEEIAPPFAVEGWNFELLPALAIFGANASGKSNILKALDTFLGFMLYGVVNASMLSQKFTPYLLDINWREADTRFEIRILAGSAVYTYHLHLNTERIVFEQLSYAVVATKLDRSLYQRRWNDSQRKYEWKNGPHFEGAHKQLQYSVNEVNPFLSLLVHLNVPVLMPLIEWLNTRTFGTGLGSEKVELDRAAHMALLDKEHLRKISALVRAFDTGIEELDVIAPSPASGEAGDFEVVAYHLREDGRVKFPLSEESTGTQRLFSLASRMILAFERSTIMLIDELGSNIHPHITREIVTMFQSPKTNPKRAQLIFTSHDNTLQRNHLLRRDQIWFTQKRSDGSTELYPLSDFKPRNDAAIDRSYFDGRFGAVPFIDADEESFAKILAGAA